jgi:hypothetical protein
MSVAVPVQFRVEVPVQFSNFRYDRNASPNTKISCILTIYDQEYEIINGRITEGVGSTTRGFGRPTDKETNVINAITEALNKENQKATNIKNATIEIVKQEKPQQ